MLERYVAQVRLLVDVLPDIATEWIATNRPRPCGPLCRLKPAFQAGGILMAVGAPAGAALIQLTRFEAGGRDAGRRPALRAATPPG